MARLRSSTFDTLGRVESDLLFSPGGVLRNADARVAVGLPAFEDLQLLASRFLHLAVQTSDVRRLLDVHALHSVQYDDLACYRYPEHR